MNCFIKINCHYVLPQLIFPVSKRMVFSLMRLRLIIDELGPRRIIINIERCSACRHSTYLDFIYLATFACTMSSCDLCWQSISIAMKHLTCDHFHILLLSQQTAVTGKQAKDFFLRLSSKRLIMVVSQRNTYPHTDLDRFYRWGKLSINSVCA